MANANAFSRIGLSQKNNIVYSSPEGDNMSDNTSIFVRYTRKRHEFEVAHLEIGEQFDEHYWLNCATFRTEGTALKGAASLYVSLSQEDRAPEYGITPLYDANNLIPKDQRTLESWMEA